MGGPEEILQAAEQIAGFAVACAASASAKASAPAAHAAVCLGQSQP